MKRKQVISQQINYSSDFDETYFERGLSTGISGYQNYRWLPKLTIPFAREIIKLLNIKQGDNFLDYGCAKGYVTLALRGLGIDALGCDVSKYAINNAPTNIKKYLSLIDEKEKLPYKNNYFKFAIAKDVFEHISEILLDQSIRELSRISKQLFVIVPLGNGEKFVIPSYEEDITHVHRQPAEWWHKKLEDNGWKVRSFSYLIPGMKDNYSHYPTGNGFFVLDQKNKFEANKNET